MFKHRIVFMLALFCLLPTQPVHAFFDAPWITPENPIAGEAVSVNIRGGVCDDIDNVQAVTRDGNAIRILFFGVRYFDSELCNIPIGQAAFPIGAYPPGSYTLQVDLMYGSVGGNLVTDTLGIVPFTVGGAPAVPAPAPVNAPAALLLMLLAMALLATWKLRARGSMWLLIGVISLSPSVRAQDVPDHPVIQLLLTTAPGAPTPDELVSYYNRSPRDGALPLQALSIGNPQDVQYLLRTALGEIEVAQQRVPDPVGEVVRIDRMAVTSREHVLGIRSARFVLALQCLANHRKHRDVAQRSLGLGVFLDFAGREGLSHEDEACVEVDVLPLQSIDLASAHAGKEAHGNVVAEVCSDFSPDPVHFVERERMHIGPTCLEALDALENVRQGKAFARLGENLAQDADDLVDG